MSAKIANLHVDRGVIPPFTTQTCPHCNTQQSNDRPMFLNAGVYARWYTEHWHSDTFGRFEDPFLQHYELWCCSVDCAEKAHKAHEGMLLLAEIDL